MPYRDPVLPILAAALAIELFASSGLHAARAPTGADPRGEAGAFAAGPSFAQLLASTSSASVAEALQGLAEAGALQDPEVAALQEEEPRVCRRPDAQAAPAHVHPA